MRILSLILALAATFLLSETQSLTCSDVEKDFDYPGNQFMTVEGLTLEGCRALCQQHEECVAWNWVSPDFPDSYYHNYCGLKTAQENGAEAPGLVSGLRECKAATTTSTTTTTTTTATTITTSTATTTSTTTIATTTSKTTTDIVCGKSTSKTVKVEDGESISFKTQQGEVYKSNTKCLVNFERGSSCAKLQFSCSELRISNKDRRGCSKGDKLVIKAIKSRKPRKIYCRSTKPDVKISGSLRVTFTSDRKKNRSGAKCMVKCLVAAANSGL